MGLRLAHELVGEPLDVVAAAPRIDDAAGAGLLLDEELRVAGDAGGEIGRQGDRLVERIGVQRLRAAVGGGQRLDGGARDVVEDVLGGEAPAAGLAVRAQRQRAGVLGRELVLDQLRPQQAGGAHLGDLHEEVHADRPEEGEPGRERVDVEAGADARAHVLDAVGQRVGELEVGRRAGLLHVIAGDGDRVELRHPRRGVGEDVGDDAHRRLGRVDVGVAHHELFEDVVLDGAGELLRRHALLLAGDDEQGQHGQHGAVHGHRHGHVGERDAGEQRAHVVDGVDRHAGHADVAAHARVIAVVAAVGGEIEGDGEALLAGGDVAAVEGVGVLGRGEAGVLPDGPRLRDVHGRVRPAQIGRDAGIAVEEIEPGGVGRRVGALDGDAFGGEPGVGGVRPLAAASGAWSRSRRGKGSDPIFDLGEIRNPAHRRCTFSNWRHSTAAVPEFSEMNAAKP